MKNGSTFAILDAPRITQTPRYEAVSPLPKDLGDLMSGLLLHRVQENCPIFLSRRKHLPLQSIFKVAFLRGKPPKSNGNKSVFIGVTRDSGYSQVHERINPLTFPFSDTLGGL